MKWVQAAVVLLVLIGSLLSVGVAAAQDEGDNGPTITPVTRAEGGVEGAEDIDFDKNQAKIDRARQTLIAIAGLMTVALIAYWWHTVPSRRLRVATKRLADHRATIQHVEAGAAPIGPNTGSVDPSDTSIDRG